VESLVKMTSVYGISEPTAHRWRKRAMAAISNSGSEGTLSGRVEADEVFIPAGRQGCRNLHRRARKRGSRRTRGSGKNNVRLYTAVARDGGEMRAVALPKATSEAFTSAVKQTVAKGARFITDGLKQYITASRQAKLKHQRLMSPRHRFQKQRGYRHLNTVNGLHAAFKTFIARFNGISGALVRQYFGWFQLSRSLRLKQYLEQTALEIGWRPCQLCGR
jgi:transposase-like protein